MSKPEIDSNGNHYWLNSVGQLHREDGPAFIYTDGTQLWYLKNNRHREDGPAILYPNGRQSWYVNDLRILSTQEFQKAANLSDEEMTLIILKYGNVG